MYPRDIRVNNASEALVVEQALAMFREMQQVAEGAADGEVLKEAEAVAVARGREFMRQSLETVLMTKRARWKKRGAGPMLSLRRPTRTSGTLPVLGRHGARAGEASAGQFCVSALSARNAFAQCAPGGRGFDESSGGAFGLPGRDELVV